MKKRNFLNKELTIKILILIILILLIAITGFRSGEKYYLLKNTHFGDSKANVESGVAKWNFNVRVRIGNEVKVFEDS